MFSSRLFMQLYAIAATAVTVAGLAWMLISPPESMRTDRYGIAHFTPEVRHPETGDGVRVHALIRHYRGD
jgi:hypothetical protein